MAAEAGVGGVGDGGGRGERLGEHAAVHVVAHGQTQDGEHRWGQVL